MTRQEELEAIRRFEEAGRIEKLAPVSDVGRVLDREREKREKQPKRSWTRSKKPAKADSGVSDRD